MKSADAMNYTEKAKLAWGNELPDWVKALAEYANQFGSIKTGVKIGRSRTAVSLIIRNKYNYSHKPIKALVQKQIMTMSCPLVGDVITHENCQTLCARPFNQTTCKNCENYREIEK